MQSQMPLYPEQASNFAPQVDNLVFFMLAVCLFFATLICAAVISRGFSISTAALV